jgi:hypothetical protein
MQESVLVSSFHLLLGLPYIVFFVHSEKKGSVVFLPIFFSCISLFWWNLVKKYKLRSCHCGVFSSLLSVITSLAQTFFWASRDWTLNVCPPLMLERDVCHAMQNNSYDHSFLYCHIYAVKYGTVYLIANNGYFFFFCVESNKFTICKMLAIQFYLLHLHVFFSLVTIFRMSYNKNTGITLVITWNSWEKSFQYSCQLIPVSILLEMWWNLLKRFVKMW